MSQREFDEIGCVNINRLLSGNQIWDIFWSVPHSGHFAQVHFAFNFCLFVLFVACVNHLTRSRYVIYIHIIKAKGRKQRRKLLRTCLICRSIISYYCHYCQRIHVISYERNAYTTMKNTAQLSSTHTQHTGRNIKKVKQSSKIKINKK